MQALTFFFAFVAVLALIGAAAWLVRRFAGNRLGANTNRGRMPRLAVIDAAAVDGRRRLVLVRRDNVEHLLMIGGPTDIVVEPNIVRAMPGRDQMAQRPVGNAEPPPRIAPLPDSNWSDGDGSRSDRADAFDHAEPQMPEPPPRQARPSFADEMRRPPSPPERRSDPLAGFAPEPIAPRADPRVELRNEPPVAPARPQRAEPMMPRPIARITARRRRRRRRRRFAPSVRSPSRRRRLPRRRRRRLRPLRRCRAPIKISPKWRSGWKQRFAGRPMPPSRGSAPRRSHPSRRRAAPRLAANRWSRRRSRRPRRRAGLRIWKTRWPPCWAVRSLLREIGNLPA